MTKRAHFLLISLLVLVFQASIANAQSNKPSLNVLLSPYTVSPNTSVGAALGLSLSPRKGGDEANPSLLIGDIRLVATFPYDRSGLSGDQNDLLASFAVLFMVVDPVLLGLQLGVASNQGIFRVPTVFYALTSRGYFLERLFAELTLGRSSAGFHYRQLALGFALW